MVSSQREIGIPLSAPQLDIYTAQKMADDKGVYCMPLAFRMFGPLNKAILEEALSEVVKRHDALRGELILDGSEPQQRIQSFTRFTLTFHEPTPSSKADEAIRKALATPFKLRGELPFRADLFRLHPEDHILLIQLHHLFGDMASLAIICRELGVIYSARVDGKTGPELPEPNGLSSGNSPATSSEDLEYWKKQLSDCSTDFELPLDKRRPAIPTFTGDVVIRDFPETTVADVTKLAKDLKCSVYMVLLAAFETLLFRYTGEQNFSIATPFSERIDPVLQNTVGYLSKLLPIVCRIKAEQEFRGLVQEVRENCIEAFSHSSVSFRQIVQQLQLSQQGARPAVARVAFQYYPEELELQLTRLKTEQFYLHNGTSKFDLCVSVGGIVGKRSIELEFDTDIFERDTIERFGQCFQRLLEEIIKDSNKAIGTYDIVSSNDKDLLRRWNETYAPYPSDATVHSLFEERVKLHPERIALLSGNRRISYHELNALADNVAANLKQAGLGKGGLVGVCIKRSPQLIAALLGILKTGAAFVPFDASYPKSRLQYLFDDSGVQLLVADKHGLDVAPANVKTCEISNLLLEKKEKQSLAPAIPASSPAYIMYTSGSTGNPKGVVVPHRAIVRLVRNNDFMGVSEEDVFLAFAPVSFDASTLEIWTPLLNGATLAVYPSEFDSAEQFAAVLNENGVTVLWLTSALFNTIADQDIQCLKGVRQLLVGGDVLSASHIRKALAALPDTRIINGYGPTENTTFTCCYTIPPKWDQDQSIPIGKPIRNTKVYILDKALQLVPVGVIGNLYAGGDGLSLGYWNKPGLTKASFIHDPFSSDPNHRLYRTGDRARFLPDGNIEFFGRKDAQVKIRGFRIELGEVENAFRSLKGVRDVVANVHQDSDSTKTLVAYIVPEPSNHPNASELLKAAREILPSPSVPSSIMFLPRLPLGPTGKVDRRSLPPPERCASIAAPVAPANSLEERIIGIWQMILGVQGVGANDSFFDLGGESLRATRAINQLNKLFDCKLAVSSIFVAPTAREMADLISRRQITESPMQN